jgi:hypothetical protein
VEVDESTQQGGTVQHSQDEKGTDQLALVTAFVIFPMCSTVAGWLFAPLLRQPGRDPYGTPDALQHSLVGAGVGLVGSLVICGLLMVVRTIWHHTNPPVGHDESPEP